MTNAIVQPDSLAATLDNLNEVFFFLSGLSVGIVFGTLFMIVIRS